MTTVWRHYDHPRISAPSDREWIARPPDKDQPGRQPAGDSRLGRYRGRRVRLCAHERLEESPENAARAACSALHLGQGKNALGLQEYLVVYGQARITEGGGADLRSVWPTPISVKALYSHQSRSAASPATSRISLPNALRAPGRGVSRTDNNDALTDERLFVRVRA